ncbi:putative uncharacterized protein C19orf81 homolog isoform X2 [Hyla sarda]|uniref:putative uncharacterized protein C19orf81 homolog isoform X2 n=1 Tax=Hyla sarda TaxID=327740 RepID=UPI0024C32B0B|nr:putative uncharacterized protein C19orf81 homolog isoform X2 [Hyla sarda]
MNKKLRKGGSKNKFTKKDFLEVDLNDLDQNVQQIQSEIAFLTETIRSKNNDLTYTLKTKEHHLKQIMQRSEELEPEKPCARTYPKPPPPQPLTLCMESPPENDFRHCNILKAIEQIVPKAFEKRQVSKIQFENTNVICGTAGRKNRWLITASDFQVRDLLLQSGLDIDGGRFPLLRHDNIIVKDYKVHLRRALSKKKILAKLVDSTELSSTP